jgi:pyridoxamine 5'-phosphate oxidase
VELQSRYEYAFGQLDIAEKNPFEQLRIWLADAERQELANGSEAGDFNAMCLSTAAPSGQPSARFVLLRGLDLDGLRFFTNYQSRKGQEIEANPLAAATFWWPALQRQVRVEGRIERLDTA